MHRGPISSQSLIFIIPGKGKNPASMETTQVAALAGKKATIIVHMKQENYYNLTI